ncbi:pullulanase-type alpha-1,6-glucosidase [Marinagarivorans algicola]|uniref:pullulanase-type alpha-1,6-glucosidase n=1 Tax=Marinagarivorans algicola TaxID=1513270 RepID=UPI0006B6061F|nr:pullulanase-type alpha-1,6-glucosidase [Marinagarivorans algicola]
MKKAIYISCIIIFVLGLSACSNNTNNTHNNNSTTSQSSSSAPPANEHKASLIYHLMPDRFANGNTDNDGTPTTGFNPKSSRHFHGGDIAGITQKLDYLSGLGISDIWLTPIFKNEMINDRAGYHGYWITDFTALDPNFGTEEELRTLIEKAKEHNIGIILDIVTNHTADVIQYSECTNCDFSAMPYTPVIADTYKTIKNPAWLNDSALYHLQGNITNDSQAITGDLSGLDDLKTSDPAVLKGFVDIYSQWATQFDIAGYRIDTAKHVEPEFWQQWQADILMANPNLDIFAEVFDGNPKNIANYLHDSHLKSGLDFGLYYAINDVFAKGESPQRIANTLKADYNYNTQSEPKTLKTFISNHDVGRLSYFIDKHQTQATPQEKLDRLIQAYGFLFTVRGTPIIYYGDEQGFIGTGEYEGARDDMFASQVESLNTITNLGSSATTADDNFDSQHPVYSALKELQTLRQGHSALAQGQTLVNVASSDTGLLIYSHFGQDNNTYSEYVVAFNTGYNTQTHTLSGADFYNRTPENTPTYTTLYSYNDATHSEGILTLPAYSFTILKSQATDTQTFDSITLTAEPAGNQLLLTATAQYASGLPILGQVTLQQSTKEQSTKEGFKTLLQDQTLPYTFTIDANALDETTAFKAIISYSTATGQSAIEQSVTLNHTTTQVEPMRVQFKKPDDWSDAVNIYFWDTQLSSFEPAWPGILMTPTGDNWYSFEFPASISSANIIFNDGNQQTENLAQNQSACYIDGQWQTQDCNAPPPGQTIFVKKPANWQGPLYVHYWDAGDATNTEWPGVSMLDLGGNWYRFTLPLGATQANIVVHDNNGSQTDNLNTASGQCFDIADNTWSPACDLTNLVGIEGASAHWIDETTLILMQPNAKATQWQLQASMAAGITINDSQLEGAQSIATLTPTELTEAQRERLKDTHKALATGTAFTVSNSTNNNTNNSTAPSLRSLIQSQLVVAQFNDDNKLLAATHVQTALVLDDQFSYTGPLGVHNESNAPTISVWAPNVQSLELQRFDSDFTLLQSHTATPDNQGVYHFVGDSTWYGQYYQFAIKAYHPASDQVEQYSATDPYSISLSSNSQYSQIIDLNDASLQPANWSALKKALPPWQNISIYEGHVRDFSAQEANIKKSDQGRYNALTYDGITAPLSNGMQHLKNLADAGLTHFHLLPVNDIATINEETLTTAPLTLEHTVKEVCDRNIVEKLTPYCDDYSEMTLQQLMTTLTEQDPSNTHVQDIISFARTEQFPSIDAFNWGYDPYHFLVPEGSYATNSQGPQRILELRNAVSSLHTIGLKTVVDVVFNHTYASGLNTQSVLDKVVPGYYHRRHPITGVIANSTCCDNTAAEHTMMEKLMRDAVVLWAKQYKIDGFRFDLMGHHPKRVMLSIREALNALTLERDGVDGANIYLYGEGWDFGEVSANQRFAQASQTGLTGTLIGTFNDRLRDGVRGGNFTDTGLAAGFASGNAVYSEPQSTTTTAQAQADAIRIGLAGNLVNYTFIDHTGQQNTGKGLNNIAYNTSPLENVLYVDKHDNETLWDNTQPKLPANFSAQERVAVHLLSQAFVNYGQGIPFHQMGTDLLRSKSMDRNSFDSGDWFNRIDFSENNDSGITNNWAQGLPPAESNSSRWEIIKTLFDNNNIQVDAALMRQAHQGFTEQLKIRYSTELLRLNNADDVNKRLKFWNTGADQKSGLIVMSISGSDCNTSQDRTFEYDGILIAFNADATAIEWQDDTLSTLPFEVHPLQNINPGSFDIQTGIFTLPAISPSVFVLPKGSAAALPCNTLQTPIQTPGITIYAKAPTEWSLPLNIHFWDTLPKQTETQWPGNTMQSIGENWFSYTLPADVNEANLILNDGNGNQTADLYRQGDGCFDISDDAWQANCDLPGITLSFKKPEHWSNNIRAYSWENGSDQNLEWPGQLMTEADGVFRVTMPRGVRSTKIIFNDLGTPEASGEQTPDLFIDQDSCYSIEDNWHSC